MRYSALRLCLFFFNVPPTPEIYPLSLPDALPICGGARPAGGDQRRARRAGRPDAAAPGADRRTALAELPRPADGGGVGHRSEEHTSELQSRQYLVCRLLLEKKKTTSADLLQNATR